MVLVYGGGSTNHNFRNLQEFRALNGRVYPIPDMTINSGEEWIIEGGVVGDLLSMKIWRFGEPEPASPQLTVRDPTPLPMGPLVSVAGSTSGA